MVSKEVFSCGSYNIFFTEISDVINVKKSTLDSLSRLKILCLRDLLFHRPIAYDICYHQSSNKLSDLPQNALVYINVVIKDITKVKNNNKLVTTIYTYNESGLIKLLFFNPIPKFIHAQLAINKQYRILGKLQIVSSNVFSIVHPNFVLTEQQISDIFPTYPLTYGITNYQLYSYVMITLEFLNKLLKSVTSTSSEIIYTKELYSLIRKIHFIDITHANKNQIDLEIEHTMNRLAYMELFANQCAVNLLNSKFQSSYVYRKISRASNLQKNILENLGFTLTSSQANAIKEIESEQFSAKQMLRLLQGDVGSGKTLVALLTMINVIASGMQAALMVPTDLLSRQHYKFFQHAFSFTSVRIVILTGSIGVKESQNIKTKLKNGLVDIVIGTHSLFQYDIEFNNLGYVVIDEQHRFGVAQRLALIDKADNPDVLIMTATPIPRSLALTMFGNIQVSKLLSKPQSNTSVITILKSITQLSSVVKSLESKIIAGEKIYWVCPLVEKSSSNNQDYLTDINTRYLLLNQYYPNIVAMLHGSMKQPLRESIMQDFIDGKYQLLLATTVIEVGLDIPNSTLIVIENAEMFGLAQLHQLRGRVGRENKQSYAILLYNPNRLSKIAYQRLKIMKESTDGFYIAEKDMLLRGSGEILGTKQSGEIKFIFADLQRDVELLLNANKAAADIQNIDSEFINFQIKLFNKCSQDYTKSL
ncbi:ATP-dependent DNA helicase RecG [Rickettsia endosymbiont of Cardiosporidium cionae]|uniref:ATP-dependent DNA helicase RecG n=1 Tax=Rickettsia endosymbiont of Cardiosporidium cionae TaxID=2777155 RepID=UPI001893335F|nr:ATP-dependent DNA helicase RecG [Rickettsia endosymbiont of Cardiosporidium cionae]KAF8818561.1 ATP-dependent DNA helicase RecG [Rickettsia endosymbiont of Cardiosporidium cionae]